MTPVTADWNLSVQQADGNALVRLLIADLAWPAAEIIDHLVALAGEQCWRHVTVDMHRVRYVTAAALGKLLVLSKELAARGGRLTLENVERDAYEIFAVTKVTAIFDVRAREACGRPAAWPSSSAGNFSPPLCQFA